MNNEKIRTEDVVEILDGKILATEGHPEISVFPRENYNSVLTKLAQRVLTEAQKAAFDAALTTPSALNPVVLKNDLETYVPLWDLGDFRDSVNQFSQLPPITTAVGTVTEGLSVISNISTASLERGKLITSSLFAAGTLIVDILSVTEIKVGLLNGKVVEPSPALASSTELITFSPQVGELRGVIDDRIIYRWNGTAWVPFTKTGTLDHTELNNQDGSNLFQHLTLAQKNTILGTTHTHSNKAILDAILSAGSGRIITNAERAALPTAKQKEALAGTSGTPSASNPYVTNADPRLNAARNPYVTIGPPGSLATFQGVDFNPFNDALQAIDIGSASTVKAIEVLAGNYNLGGVSLIWDTQSSSLLMENFTPMTTILSFFNTPWGIQAKLTGGPLILRGFIFELNEEGTSGVFSTREHTIIEDCVFRVGLSAAAYQKGIQLSGAGSIVRRCKFLRSSSGETLYRGITVNAPNCRIENCTFDVGEGSALLPNAGVEIASGGNYALVDHCTFVSGKVSVAADVNFTNIINNRFYGLYQFTSKPLATPPQRTAITAAPPSGDLNTFNLTNSLTDGDYIKFIGTLPPLMDDAYYFVRNRTSSSFQLSRLASGDIITFAGLNPSTTYTGNFSHNTLADAITDNGVGTRYLENMPEDINQPFIARRRTIGQTGTYADYRDNTEIPFLAALADPNVTEIEVLEGTYTFASTVNIPAGKSIRGVRQGLEAGGVIIQGSLGITPFELSNNAKLENLVIKGEDAHLVLGAFLSGVVLDNCKFELTASSDSIYEVIGTECADWFIHKCYFTGYQGLKLVNSIRTRVTDCLFMDSSSGFVLTGGDKDHIKGNHFITAAAPQISGNLLMVENNEFLGALPTKLNTSLSIWQGNWPHPSANNDAGVDTMEINLDRHLDPTSDGVEKSIDAGIGTLRFIANVTSSSSTLPIELPAKVDKTKSFSVSVYWTAPTGAEGSVVWRVTTVFRDNVTRKIGTQSQISSTSLRTVGRTLYDEDFTTVTFANYGLGALDPTHMSVTVERVGTSGSDTLNISSIKSVAHLTEVKVVLPRD